jgi:hypothetical protein
MAKFDLQNQAATTITVHKTTAAYMVDFALPDSAKETMTATEVSAINGVFCVSYYDVPMVGDIVIHKGHQWQITERLITVTRWHDTRSKKQIPTIKVQYLGPCPQ